jgi:hypothetical protein
MTTVLDPLGELANYPADFVHVDKQCYPGAELALTGGRLKWAEIRRGDEAADPAVTEQARSYLRAENEAGRLPLRGELGFVLLHRDGGKHFIIVCVWRNTDSLWSGIYRQTADGFELYPRAAGHLQPAQCVVEGDAISHERRAWSRYLRSARDSAAKRVYLDDACTGELV